MSGPSTFWAGYFAAAAAGGAQDARDRGEDPVDGALEGMRQASTVPGALGLLLAWFFLTMIGNYLLIQVGFPAQSMFTWCVAAVLVFTAPVLVVMAFDRPTGSSRRSS